MTLRRRISHLLASLFLAFFLPALVGAVYTAWKDSVLAAFLTIDAFIAGAALATFVGERALIGVVLGAILTVLALGAAALALAGLPLLVAFTAGALAFALLLLILARALLAAGSADQGRDPAAGYSQVSASAQQSPVSAQAASQ